MNRRKFFSLSLIHYITFVRCSVSILICPHYSTISNSQYFWTDKVITAAVIILFLIKFHLFKKGSWLLVLQFMMKWFLSMTSWKQESARNDIKCEGSVMWRELKILRGQHQALNNMKLLWDAFLISNSH